MFESQSKWLILQQHNSRRIQMQISLLENKSKWDIFDDFNALRRVGGCKFSPSFFRTWKGLHFHMRNMEDLLAPIKCVALGWPTQLDHGHRFLHLSSFGAPSNFCTFVVVTIYTAGTLWSVGERKRDAIYQIQITTHSKCDMSSLNSACQAHLS